MMPRRPLTPEEKEDVKRRSLAWWATQTPEAKAARRQRAKDKREAKLAAMTPAEREAVYLANVQKAARMRTAFDDPELEAARRAKLAASAKRQAEAMTSEQRAQKQARQSAGIKAAWDRLTPEERQTRIQATVDGMHAPGISERHSASAKEACANKTPEARAASLANLELSRTPDVVARAQATLAPKRRAIQKAAAPAKRAAWHARPEADKQALIHRMVRASAKVYRLVDGTDQFFHSSWEADVANAMIRSGVRYVPQLLFVLGDVRYLADFWVPADNLIIEVKGHPRAWKRWHEVTLPALKTHGSRDFQYTVMSTKLLDGACWPDVQAALDPVELDGPARLSPAQQRDAGVLRVVTVQAEPEQDFQDPDYGF